MKLYRLIILATIAMLVVGCEKDSPERALTNDEKFVIDEVNCEMLSSQIQMLVIDAIKLSVKPPVEADQQKILDATNLLTSFDDVVVRVPIAPATHHTLTVNLEGLALKDKIARKGTVTISLLNLEVVGGDIHTISVSDFGCGAYSLSGDVQKSTQSVVSESVIEEDFTFETKYSGKLSRTSKIYSRAFNGLVTSTDGRYIYLYKVEHILTELNANDGFIRYELTDDSALPRIISKTMDARLVYDASAIRMYQGPAQITSSLDYKEGQVSLRELNDDGTDGNKELIYSLYNAKLCIINGQERVYLNY